MAVNPVDPLHLKIARGFIGQKEYQGANRSFWIDRFNRNAGSALGSPYCMAFQLYCLDSAEREETLTPTLSHKREGVKINYPHTALATAFKTKRSYNAARVLQGMEKIKAGDILTWQKGKTIFGHAGIASKDWNGNKGMTIQANTSKFHDSREGDGIWEKPAEISLFNTFRIIRVTPIGRN